MSQQTLNAKAMWPSQLRRLDLELNLEPIHQLSRAGHPFYQSELTSQ